MRTILMAILLAQQPPGVVGQVYEMSGQVDRVDQTGRLVSITSAGVVHAPIYVGPHLPIFDQLVRGDVVVIRYYDSYIVEATPGARMAGVENLTDAANQEVKRPDANVLQQLRMVVTIDEINREKNLVTYHGVDNRRVLRAVQSPQLLEGLSAGDVVTITYTRAQAVSIVKPQ